MAQKRRIATESHEFYCIKCGRQTIPLSRKASQAKEKFHRKKLYCPWCRLTLNCIEVRNQQEKDEFIEKFQKGEFENEIEESVRISGGPGLRQELLRKDSR